MDGTWSVGDKDKQDDLNNIEDCLDVSSEGDEELVHVATSDESSWVLPCASYYSFN